MVDIGDKDGNILMYDGSQWQAVDNPAEEETEALINEISKLEDENYLLELENDELIKRLSV